MTTRKKQIIVSGVIVLALGVAILGLSRCKFNPQETLIMINTLQTVTKSTQSDLSSAKTILHPQSVRAMPPLKLVKYIDLLVPSPNFPCRDCGVNLTVTQYHPDRTITINRAPVEPWLEYSEGARVVEYKPPQ